MEAPRKMIEWRKREGIPQCEAADRCDVSQASWSEYEAGRKKPRIDQALRIEESTDGFVTVGDWRESEPERRRRRRKIDARRELILPVSASAQPKGELRLPKRTGARQRAAS